MDRLGLGAHRFVPLAVVGAAFGMAHDDKATARVAQHFGADISGMGARRRRVTVLSTQDDRAGVESPVQLGEQRRRRAHDDVAPWRGAERLGGKTARKGDTVGAQTVHFPVSGNQLAPFGHLGRSISCGSAPGESPISCITDLLRMA